ncbi:hypothetical protein OG539_17620 [Actinacidiphila glaucinigra]|uniref:hypothetical protein n=1 Tax=Actinacidiphila glaucinigra TaxID=235986 RepID=UPI002DDA4194|nr:hypothetical protein [Actinacidiphila glaucinigra]WSD61947.1 hypothetical protein OIE69_25160 [Actinacidiphila glaucinigra]
MARDVPAGGSRDRDVRGRGRGSGAGHGTAGDEGTRARPARSRARGAEPALAAEGTLDAHAALPRQAVEKAPGAFVTIELDEIEGLCEEGTFQPALRAALACFDAETDPAAGRARPIDLSQLRPERPFPPARLLVDGLEAGYGDYWNLVRLLGASHLSRVPWETEAASG